MSGERLVDVSDLIEESQIGQQKHVIQFFEGKRNGYFVDVGAHNGFCLSNTVGLEHVFGWKGVCAEPLKREFEMLIQNRKCYCTNKAVFHTSGQVVSFSCDGLMSGITDSIDCHMSSKVAPTVSVETITLNDLLVESGAPRFIEYISIDTEGSEYDILKAFDFSRHVFGFMTVEHNFVEPRRTLMRELLTANGYLYLCENQFDDYYIHKSQLEGTYYLNEEYENPYIVKISEKGEIIMQSYKFPDLVGKMNTKDGKVYFDMLGPASISHSKLVFGDGYELKRDQREAVVFIGANDMCEIAKYNKIYNRGLFVEAMPHVHKKLARVLESANILYNTQYTAVNALITSESRAYEFNVFNNFGASSSIYKSNEACWNFPDVQQIYAIPLQSQTMDELMKDFNEPKFDLILDVQGAELEVLKGCGPYFNRIQTITTEVSLKQIYDVGVLFEELNAFFESHGFTLHPAFVGRVPEHGDVVYIRKPVE